MAVMSNKKRQSEKYNCGEIIRTCYDILGFLYRGRGDRSQRSYNVLRLGTTTQLLNDKSENELDDLTKKTCLAFYTKIAGFETKLVHE